MVMRKMEKGQMKASVQLHRRLKLVEVVSKPLTVLGVQFVLMENLFRIITAL